MKILGIDPGYALIGYGVISYDKGKFKTVNFGAVTTSPQLKFEQRLEVIYRDINQLINEFKPDALSIEKLFFNTNTTTAIDVAQARGVILLAAQMNNVPVFEYTPLQVKSAVTGFGRAEKHQVMEMTRSLLGLSAVPKPDDTADALALAICHANTGTSSYAQILKGDLK
ncbi:MAG: crossover junction endodeoxyribonuclease RuvC [Acutalibacteraceae bacterium]|nr:crossover junction endodeoxyribonuclease RuvC [Acutalibacteraceae bacterium]